MANNKTGKDAAGSTFTYRTDDVAGVDYPIVKLADGTEDSTGLIGGDAANGLDVDVTRVPADPFGANADAAVAAGAAGSIQAKLRRATTDLGALLTEIQNLTQVEDVAHVSGDTGILPLAVRNDTPGSLVSANGDYAPIQVDNNGYLRVRVDAGSTAGTEYTEGDVDATISGSAMLWEDTGDTLRAVSTAKPLPTAQQGTANVAAQATENVIGATVGKLVPITPVMTITAGAYVAGRVIGGKLTLTNAMRVSSGTGMLHALTIVDKANVKPELRCLLFNANPAGTFTDATQHTINTADYAAIIADLYIAPSNWVTYDDSGTDWAVATLRGLGQLVAANGSQNLYAVFIVVGTPTFTSTSQLVPTFWFAQN